MLEVRQFAVSSRIKIVGVSLEGCSIMAQSRHNDGFNLFESRYHWSVSQGEPWPKFSNRLALKNFAKVCSVRLGVPASRSLPPPPTKPPPQVVWSAKRNLLVGLNATVLFSANGDLILLDANGIAVWSTSSSDYGGNTLSLTDSGNLLILYPTRSSRHVHRFALIFVPSIHEI
ncbi:hypothetical protein KSP40_PGU020315 [Platanthera guangdongensis]|uniref:Bulb-type lectin domain-containing protein n=1 Tax=Platanthera guangdongensis TaxID=2320717 RepID=A0ABR2MNZ1_9ASPA